MYAAYSTGCSTMLHKEQNTEECDATRLNSSNAVGFKVNIYYLNAGSVKNYKIIRCMQ